MNDIQKAILKIYVEVSNLCRTNNIPYYAIGGTCIGAVRHKGFIPWDDDIDIAIPIEKYEYFIELAKRNLPDNLKVITSDDRKHTANIFIKVMDANTTFIETQEFPYSDAYKGIFVDIMPLSGIPRQGIKRTIFIAKIKLYQRLNYVRRYPLKEMRHPIMKILWRLIHFNQNENSLTKYSRKWLNLLKKHPFFEADYTGYVWRNPRKDLIFSKKIFETTVDLPFEETTMSCPGKWSAYLGRQFGDYMKLPPEEERYSLHEGIVRTDIPYDYFYNHMEELTKFDKGVDEK